MTTTSKSKFCSEAVVNFEFNSESIKGYKCF